METFFMQMLAPFALVVMLAIAHPFKKFIEWMPDSKWKRFLLIRWN